MSRLDEMGKLPVVHEVRTQSGSMSGMYIAAILTLLLALGLGIWAMADYSGNEKNRTRHVLSASTNASDYDMLRVNRDDDRQRQDGFVGVIACGMFIASIVMFSKSKKSTTELSKTAQLP